MHNLHVTLGMIIRRRRKEAGLSMKALAARAGIYWNYISVLERGEVLSPGLASLICVAGGLGTTPDELLKEARELAVRAA
jgi:transcriptional regulator with XRE-family HTH domain